MALNLQVLNTEADTLGNSKPWDLTSLKIMPFTDMPIQLREGKGENKLKEDTEKAG